MGSSMFGRMGRYWQRAGRVAGATLTVLIGLMVLMMVLTAGTAGGTYLLAAGVGGFVLPRAFVPFFIRHWGYIYRPLNVLGFCIIALVVLRSTGVWRAPGPVWVVLIPVVALHAGTGFWTVSDRRFGVPRGYRTMGGLEVIEPGR